MALAKKIDHVAVAVRDIKTAANTLRTHFGFPVQYTGLNKNLHQHWALLPVGDCFLELFQPTDDTNPGAQSLQERGEGLYALSFEVESLADAADHLVKHGISVNIQTLDDRMSACFINPRHTNGVLISLVEYTKKSAC